MWDRKMWRIHQQNTQIITTMWKSRLLRTFLSCKPRMVLQYNNSKTFSIKGEHGRRTVAKVTSICAMNEIVAHSNPLITNHISQTKRSTTKNSVIQIYTTPVPSRILGILYALCGLMIVLHISLQIQWGPRNHIHDSTSLENFTPV